MSIESEMKRVDALLDERLAAAKAMNIRVGGYVSMYRESEDVWHEVTLVLMNPKILGPHPVIKKATRRSGLFDDEYSPLWDVRAFSPKMPKTGTIYTKLGGIEYRY